MGARPAQPRRTPAAGAAPAPAARAVRRAGSRLRRVLLKIELFLRRRRELAASSDCYARGRRVMLPRLAVLPSMFDGLPLQADAAAPCCRHQRGAPCMRIFSLLPTLLRLRCRPSGDRVTCCAGLSCGAEGPLPSCHGSPARLLSRQRRRPTAAGGGCWSLCAVLGAS